MVILERPANGKGDHCLKEMLEGAAVSDSYRLGVIQKEGRSFECAPGKAHFLELF